jgi:hypothetical protein
VELPPPPPDRRMLHLGGLPRFPPPPAYVQVHHAHNAHVPIAHPVVVQPIPALPPLQINPGHLFGRGPPVYYGGLGQRPLPRLDAPVMPLPQPHNLMQARPAVPYNLRTHHVPTPPLPRPPFHHKHMAPQIQVAGRSGRGKRRR